MLNKPLKITAIVLAGFFICQMASAAISLDRTRIIFDAESDSLSLNITNQSENSPYLIQSWIEDANGKKIQSPFAVLPPLQRLEAKNQSQLKIEALPAVSALPQDRETVYYFNMREIPPKSSKENTLQITLQMRIKLFYRPQSLKVTDTSTPWQEKLTLLKENDKYIIQNPTPYYVTIVDAIKAKEMPASESFTPVMIEPNGRVDLAIQASQLGNSPVLTYVSDYGGQLQLNFSCSKNECHVMPEIASLQK